MARHTLGADGKLDLASARVLLDIPAQGRLRNFSLLHPVDFKVRPDGDLYAINHGSSSSGAIPLAAILRLVRKGCPVASAPALPAAARCRIAGRTLYVTGGVHAVQLRVAAGRRVRSFDARAGGAHRLEFAGPPGVYLVEVGFPEGGGRWIGLLALAGP